MTMAQAYTRFMVLFFFVVGTLSIVKPITDAPGGGFVMWPEAGRVFGVFLINWWHFVIHIALALLATWALRSTPTARAFGWVVFAVCAVLVLIGLLTPDGIWLVPATYGDDVANGQVTLVTMPGWWGFLPANPPDDVLNALVGLSGLFFAVSPIGLRPWGYWRRERATTPDWS